MGNIAPGSKTTAYDDTRVEEERPYTWLEDYLDRLEGKEVRWKYYECYDTCEHRTVAA
jgi:hypothetical protein